MNRYPVIPATTDDHNIAIYQGQPVKLGKFKAHVQQLIDSLSEHEYAINFCDNRYHFLVAFVAAMLKGHITLMPGSRAKSDIDGLKTTYPDHYQLDDQHLAKICQNQSADYASDTDWSLPNSQIVAILFTSGTQGTPRANFKTWGQLWKSAMLVKKRFNLNSSQQQLLVATIPSQHMFGFEMTIVAPLVHGNCVHDAMPFYPVDVQKLLSDYKPESCVLITTPLQLRSLLEAQLDWPVVDCIISATAPLTSKLATEAEQQMHTHLYEIYGCSEVGAIATRHTTAEECWTPLEGYQLITGKQSSLLTAPGYESPVDVPDIITMVTDTTFILVGRQSDVIKIAGKRASLQQLTNALKSLDGVDDAVVFMPQQRQDNTQRTAALVVAPGKSIAELRQALYQYIDPAFIPRPFVKVTELPYNKLGKLRRERLEQSLREALTKSSSERQSP